VEWHIFTSERVIGALLRRSDVMLMGTLSLYSCSDDESRSLGGWVKKAERPTKRQFCWSS
jgi:hypothetical protein